MGARVIQGFFPGGAPRPGPAGVGATRRSPGPPAPAFAGSPAAPWGPVQAKGGNEFFQIDPARVGLANGGGDPLPDAVRGKMEAALRADFSNVRVHVGPQAERIGAIAFTMGADIYFARGRFQPDTVKGRQLLGHELAHVIQQRQGRVRAPTSGVAVVQDRALEAEADRLGRRAVAAREPTPAIPPAAAGRSENGAAQQTVQRAPIQPARAAVIQRVGDEPLTYILHQRLAPPPVRRPGERRFREENPTAMAERLRLNHLVGIIGNIVETLRLRTSINVNARERAVARKLTSLSDPEKVDRIKFELEWEELPVPATTDLQTLLANRDVQSLLATKPRFAEEIKTLEAQEKSATIKTHAFAVDADGPGPLPSRRFDFDTLTADPVLRQFLQTHGLGFVGAQIQTASGHVLVDFYRGDDAFVPKTVLGQALQRPVYQKRGKAPGASNEYVKDDMGVFTRRYAYVEKNKYQFRDLANDGRLAGRYPTDVSKRVAPAYNAIDKDVRGRIGGLPASKTFASGYHLAYVHQELGSGYQQRGVSASATGKHTIFSNQGKPFRTRDGVRITVDLARVPIGNEQAPILVNHYAHASAGKRADPVSGSSGLVIRGNRPRKYEHYKWSIKKNRELFIKEVTPENIVALELHETASGSSARQEERHGFDAAKVRDFGANVGLAEYNRGFEDGCYGNVDASATIHLSKRRYYIEGYRDGVLYADGWQHAAAKRPKPKDIDEDSQTRFKQGYYDRLYGRPVRRY